MKKVGAGSQTIRYYKGTIRDLQSQVKNLNKTVEELSGRMSKISSNTDGFAGQNLVTSIPEGLGQPLWGRPSEGVVNKDDIKTIVQEMIDAGEISTIESHDHSAPDKGGYCYAYMGAALIE